MNKVKMFFVAAALVLTTAGVFAGKFIPNGDVTALYYKSGTGYYPAATTITTGSSDIFVQSVTANPAVLSLTAGTYNLYYKSGTSYFQAYVQF